MRILVLIKPVALLDTAIFHADHTIERAKSRHAISPSDAYALLLARGCKRDNPDVSITVLSMSSEAQRPLLESLKAYEIDQMVHLSDRAFSKSDTLVTAKILSIAIERLEPFSLILAGQMSTDAETAQVPAQLATLLDFPFISSVEEIELLSHTVEVRRYLEYERQTWKLPLPAILSVCSKGQGLQPPSLKGLRKARSVSLVSVSNEDLAFDTSTIGSKGSPTMVVRCSRNQLERRNSRVVDDPIEGARLIWEAVKSAKSESHDQTIKRPKVFMGSGCDETVIVLSFLFDPISYNTSLQIVGELSQYGKPPIVMALGEKLSEEMIRGFESSGAGKVRYLACPDTLAEDLYAKYIENKLGSSVKVVLGGASIRMRTSMAMLSAKTESGLAADCTAFSIDEGILEVVRPAFGGNVEATIHFRSRIQMATIRANAYPVLEYIRNDSLVVERTIEKQCESRAILSKRQVQDEGKRSDGTIVFSIGNGIQDEAVRNLIYSFGFERAASRVAVNGFNLDYGLQVGQTGRLIGPKVYVGFGISGAFQHIVGIKNSKMIIAVNNDPKAPIFDYADIAIRSDASQVLSALKDLSREEDEGGRL
jgi:electron transfer flavoprotein alpha subunit